MPPATSHTATEAHTRHQPMYGRLLAMVLLSFLVMYVLMYAMVNTFANV